MDPTNTFTYKDISPDTLSGFSAGSQTAQRVGEDISYKLFYVLGMNFLTQHIKADQYDNEHVKGFCQQLVHLFTGEGMPYLAEDRSVGDDKVTFVYDGPIKDSDKKHISKMVADAILKHPSFAHKRSYYIDSNGLENITKVHKTLDEWGKDNIYERVNNPYAVSLVGFEDTSAGNISAGDVVLDDLAQLYQDNRLLAEDTSLRHSFGKETFDEYVESLYKKGSNIELEYEKELGMLESKPWKLAILSSIIAYQTTDKKMFFRMMMRKTGHIQQIAQSIRKHYAKDIQRDIIPSHEDICDEVLYKLNYVLIEALQLAFNQNEPLPLPAKIKDKRAQRYKNVFYKSLCAANRFDLQPSNIDILIDYEQDNRDLFDLYFTNREEELTTWMVTELRKYNPDFILISNESDLLDDETFLYTDTQLVEYIDNADFGLLKSTAIWLYIFNATSLIDFSERFQKYTEPLYYSLTFGTGLEFTMDEIYPSLLFNELYEKINVKAMMIVLKKRIAAIQTIIAYTQDIHAAHIDSYDEEYKFLLECLNMVMYPEKNESGLYDLIGKYTDLVEGYGEDLSDNNDDDENEFSY